MSKYLGPRVALTVRMPEELRARLALEAKKRDTSINNVVNLFLSLELAANAVLTKRKK